MWCALLSVLLSEFVPSRMRLNVNRSGSTFSMQYQRVGIYSVADGHTVAEFLDSIT